MAATVVVSQLSVVATERVSVTITDSVALADLATTSIDLTTSPIVVVSDIRMSKVSEVIRQPEVPIPLVSIHGMSMVADLSALDPGLFVNVTDYLSLEDLSDPEEDGYVAVETDTIATAETAWVTNSPAPVSASTASSTLMFPIYTSIIGKSVYSAGTWKPVLSNRVYNNSVWKPVKRLSGYGFGWLPEPDQTPAAPIIQSAVNSAGVTPNTFKYTAGGGESNILRSGEFIIFGNVRLIMQEDGNLVGTSGGIAVFSTHTFSPVVDGSYYFEAASDGNFYIKNSAGVKVGGQVGAGVGSNGRTWTTSGLKAYLEAGGSGTLNMTGSKIVIQKDMHIVWASSSSYPSQPPGVGIGNWADFYEYGILQKSAAHPFLPYYPADASSLSNFPYGSSTNPLPGGTTFKLYTYSSAIATKGSLVETRTGDWGKELRSTAPIDTTKPFKTYEIATISPTGIEGPTTTFKWKLGSAEVPAVAAVYGWGASTGYTSTVGDNFYASLGEGTTAGSGSSVNDVLTPSGAFRAYQEDRAALQPENAYGFRRWIGNGTWSGYPSSSLLRPSINLHARYRLKITRVKVIYERGAAGNADQVAIGATGYADGFSQWELITFGGTKDVTNGEAEWTGMGIDVGAGLAIVIRCNRGAINTSGAVSTDPPYGLYGKCQIWYVYIDSQPWQVITAGSAGIAATTGSQWQ